MNIEKEANLIKSLIKGMEADPHYKAGLYNGVEWLLANIQGRDVKFIKVNEVIDEK